jgi:hypothetical protein
MFFLEDELLSRGVKIIWAQNYAAVDNFSGLRAKLAHFVGHLPSGFPLAHSASHQLRAIGFANIFAFNEDVEHAHVPSIIVQVKLTTPQS